MPPVDILAPRSIESAPTPHARPMQASPRRHADTSRYELKYIVDELRARGIRDFIRPYLERDRHSLTHPAYAYPIYTLYLDSPGLGLYSATCEGLKNRYKLRIRYYDHDPQSPTYFEIKRRVGDVILKERTAIVRSSVAKLLAGGCPGREDVAPGGDTDDYLVLKRFCELRSAIDATPRVLVHYLREAWVSPHDAKLRISFDRKLATTRYRGQLQPQRWIDAHLPDVILELKFNDRFPVWMRELVHNWDLYRSPMAKYVHCTDQLPHHATLRAELP